MKIQGKDINLVTLKQNSLTVSKKGIKLESESSVDLLLGNCNLWENISPSVFLVQKTSISTFPNFKPSEMRIQQPK